jgi:hypothetical protein
MNDDFLRLLAANVRIPMKVVGDCAQLACRIGSAACSNWSLAMAATRAAFADMRITPNALLGRRSNACRMALNLPII